MCVSMCGRVCVDEYGRVCSGCVYGAQSVFACIRVCMGRLHSCVYMFDSCMRAPIHMCMHARMHAYMYVGMCVYVCGALYVL